MKGSSCHVVGDATPLQLGGSEPESVSRQAPSRGLVTQWLQYGMVPLRPATAVACRRRHHAGWCQGSQSMLTSGPCLACMGGQRMHGVGYGSYGPALLPDVVADARASSPGVGCLGDTRSDCCSVRPWMPRRRNQLSDGLPFTVGRAVGIGWVVGLFVDSTCRTWVFTRQGKTNHWRRLLLWTNCVVS